MQEQKLVKYTYGICTRNGYKIARFTCFSLYYTNQCQCKQVLGSVSFTFFTLRSGKTCFLIISTSAFCYVKFQCCLEGMSLIFSLEDIECTQIVAPVL